MSADTLFLAHQCRIAQAHPDRALAGDKNQDFAAHPLPSANRHDDRLISGTLQQNVLPQANRPIPSNLKVLPALCPRRKKPNARNLFHLFFT